MPSQELAGADTVFVTSTVQETCLARITALTPPNWQLQNATVAKARATPGSPETVETL